MSNRTFHGRLAAALLLAACVTPKLHPYELDEAHIGAPGVETVALLPLNVLAALPPELDDSTRRVTSVIREHLSACDVKVVRFRLSEARRLWNEVADGEEEVDDERVARYVKRLHATRVFDVLIVPSLVYRDARIRDVTREVVWDGVKRQLELSGYVHKHGSIHVMTEVRGKTPAVSLHVAVYETTGAKIFDSFGGLDLVHEVDFGAPRRQDLDHRIPLPQVEFRLKEERLRDRTALREGVAMAFTPYLDPPAPVAASAGSGAP